MLSFRLFDMEADPTCRYDYLDVYNGHTRLVQKLGRFCGTFRPGALISTSNTMMLEMISDEGTGGRGFLAAFSAGKPHMEGVTQMEMNPWTTFVKCFVYLVVTPVHFHRGTVLWWTADQITGFCQDTQLAQLQLPSRHQLLLAHYCRTKQCKQTVVSFLNLCYHVNLG